MAQPRRGYLGEVRPARAPLMLTVLNVGYPLAPVGRDTAGGAEQVLAQIDAALAAAGHRSIVIGGHGSHSRGVTIDAAGQWPFDDIVRAQITHHCRQTIASILSRYEVDLIPSARCRLLRLFATFRATGARDAPSPRRLVPICGLAHAPSGHLVPLRLGQPAPPDGARGPAIVSDIPNARGPRCPCTASCATRLRPGTRANLPGEGLPPCPRRRQGRRHAAAPGRQGVPLP